MHVCIRAVPTVKTVHTQIDLSLSIDGKRQTEIHAFHTQEKKTKNEDFVITFVLQKAKKGTLKSKKKN